LIHRLLLEMQLSTCMAVQDAIRAQTGRPVPANRAAYLLIILSRSRRFWGLGLATSSRPATQVDGISVSAIAASFDQPFETARRHANALIADGFCYRSGPRICIRPEQFENPAFVAMLCAIHDAMVRLVDHAAALGVALPEQRNGKTYEGDAGIAAAIDLLLAVYDYGAPYYDNWLQMRVLSALFCANARRVTLDPVLAARYADEEAVTPDDLQVPVSGRAIARAMNLPYSTVRRQIEVAIRRGWIVRRNGGLIRSRTHQISPEAQHVNRVASLRVLKMFESLASAGFRFRDPASHYHDRAPPLLDFS
jgi:DNA-binding MarR family transcriptional regulator